MSFELSKTGKRLFGYKFLFINFYELKGNYGERNYYFD